MSPTRFSRLKLAAFVATSTVSSLGLFGALVACSSASVASSGGGDGSVNDARGDSPADAPNDAPSMGDAGMDGDAQAPSGPCALGDLPSGAMIVDVTSVSSASLAMAVTNAATYLAAHGNNTYVIRLPAGISTCQ